MATSVKHSGWKKTAGQDYLSAYIMGGEALRITVDGTGNFGSSKVGTAYEALASIIDGYGVSLATGYSGSSSNRLHAFEINADTGSTDLTGDTMVGAIRGRTVVGTTQTNCTLQAIQGCVDVGTVSFQGNLWGVHATLDFYGNVTVGSGAACYAGPISCALWNEATTTLGAGAVLCGIDLYEIGAVGSTGSGALNPAINIRGNWAQALAFKSGAGCYAVNTATPGVATAWDIVVNMGGTEGYIPVYSDRTWAS